MYVCLREGHPIRVLASGNYEHGTHRAGRGTGRHLHLMQRPGAAAPLPARDRLTALTKEQRKAFDSTFSRA